MMPIGCRKKKKKKKSGGVFWKMDAYSTISQNTPQIVRKK
jgi:hypothetical protein